MESVPLVLGLLLWVCTALFASSMLFWLYEMAVSVLRYESPQIEHGPEEVQVRILTVGTNEQIVQQTVDALPSELTDVHVISEQQLSIEGALVHVVPSTFDCAAEQKGRAIEWARRTVPCDREYVLYLDEDTVVDGFEGVPDADVVQFGESPTRTASLLSHWAEVFRMGFQYEMRAFPSFDIPLYAWGGGLAIRHSLENEITWDFSSMIEDTAFVWRALATTDADFAFVDARFRNQSPPSIRSMIRQRRRWLAGSREHNDVLPTRILLLVGLRNLSWGLSPIVPFLWLFPDLLSAFVVFEPAYVGISVCLYAVLLLWGIVGVRYMREGISTAIPLLALAPIVVTIHSVGALYGIISPPGEFTVTEKVTRGTPHQRSSETTETDDPPFPVSSE
jgi:hypothetical protein